MTFEAQSTNNEARIAELDQRGRAFAIALRETIGDRLAEGLMIRPETNEPYDIEVDAMTADTAVQHQTAAILHIKENEQATRFLVGASEPTRFGARVDGGDKPEGWVALLDPDGAPEESGGIGEKSRLAMMAMQEVETAFDKGDVRIYDRSGSLLV